MKKFKHEKQQTVSAASVTRSMRVRAVIAAAVFCCAGFGAVIYNLVQYQLIDEKHYKEKAAAQQLSDEIIDPHRGTIYDANMKILARSSTVWTIVASPYSMNQNGTNVNMVATKLSEILGLPAEEILAKLLKTESAYQPIKRKVEKPVADQIMAWIQEYNKTDAAKTAPITGISLEQDSKRYYPYGSLASTMLGFTNSDGAGLTGVELRYNDDLTGTPGRILTAKNAMGYEMDGDYKAEYPAEDGYSLVLTLDETVQQCLEKYLNKAIKDSNVSNRGCGIVMNVKTGAILAMATLPDYDLNDPYTLYDTELANTIAAIGDETERTAARQKAQQEMWRNKAVQDIYEPGSVFKVITASAALDSGKADLNTSFSCAGRLHIVNDISMRCAHEEGHGTLDFYGGLNNSCNPYFIQLAWQMGKETFCDYLQAFGFYEKTGIDVPNEAQSNVYPVDKMNITELSSSAFGQSSQVTPIEMITAVSAAVNGGKLLQPYVVQQVLDKNGNIVENREPNVKRQVISEETSAILAGLLEKSVATGQNKLANVKGYRVGGKSGTSQKQTVTVGNEEDTLRIASFCGFAPADDPEIACIIVLDEPHDKFNSFGGRLCGPVVGSIMAETLPYLGVEPQYTEEDLATVAETIPNVTGMTVLDANSKLNALGFATKESGGGDAVTYQYPAAGTSLSRQSVVVLYTDEGSQGTNVIVPDTAGKSVPYTREMLKSSGLNLEIAGVDEENPNVQAMSQSIAAGTEVTMGTVVQVTFHDITV
ncbi:MAG: penicillin-binding transpeptidase domain-containing protein, partial [Ruthenibacterium sp.]